MKIILAILKGFGDLIGQCLASLALAAIFGFILFWLMSLGGLLFLVMPAPIWVKIIVIAIDVFILYVIGYNSSTEERG